MCNNLSAWVAFPRWLVKWNWMPFHLYICYYCFYLLELLNCCAAYNTDSVFIGGLENKCHIYGDKQRRGGSQWTFFQISNEDVNDLHNFRRSTCQCTATAEHEFAECPSETCSEPLLPLSFGSCPLGREALKYIYNACGDACQVHFNGVLCNGWFSWIIKVLGVYLCHLKAWLPGKFW